MNQSLPYRNGHLLVIYDAQVFESFRRKRSNQKKASYFFLLIFFLSTAFLVWPVVAAKVFSSKGQNPSPLLTSTNLESQKTEQKTETENNFKLDDWLNQKGISSPPDRNFSIIIPQLNISAKVIPSVDLSDEGAMQKALKEGVIQAQGGASPGQGGTTYIFGHSTDSPLHIELYNAIFYPLKDIKENEEVIIIYKGMPYTYKVEEKKIIAADNIQYLTNFSGEEKLALLTCWPPGTTLKRLLIMANRI